MNTPAFPPARARACLWRMRPCHRKASGGFTLIEVLVALLLFSIGILGLIGLQARAISVSSDAEDRNRASLIADQCASAMQLQANSMTYASYQSSPEQVTGLCHWAFVNNPTQGGLPNGAISTTVASLPTGTLPQVVPVSIDITVTWEPPARANANGAVNTQTQSQFTTRVTLLLSGS